MIPTVYMSEAWQQNADLLLHLSEFSHNLLLVIAPEQAGKTTFLNEIMQRECPSLKRIPLTVSPGESVEAFMQEVAAAFECVWEDVPYLTEQLQAYIETASAQRMGVVLLVDNAHLLSDEHIQALLILASWERPIEQQLHIILLGEPSLELRLLSTQWSDSLQDRVHTLELEPWTIDDIKAYWGQDPSAPCLREEQWMRLSEETGGLPGEVAQYKTQMALSTKKKHKLRFPTHPVVIGIAVGSVMGGSYLLFSGINDAEDAGAAIQLTEVAEDKWEEELSFQEPVAIARNVPKTPVLSVTEDDQPALLPATIPPAPVVQKTQIPVKKVLAKAKKDSKPLASSAIAPIARSAPPAPPAPPHSTLSDQEKQLLGLKKNHYTLQLIGARGERNVKEFMDRHGISKEAYCYRTRLSGKDWYVVVYGEYSSKEAAKQAAMMIPPSLRKENLKPWVRDLESVHHDIRERRQA